MNSFTSRFFLLAALGALFLSIPSAQAFSQSGTPKLGLQSLLDFSFDVVLTFDDNSTQTVTLQPSDETVIDAPAGKTITSITAGTKTESLPLNPSPQTGWNIPNTPSGATVYATDWETGRSFGDWRSNFLVDPSSAISFTY